MHEDIKCSHKDLFSKKNELILNNKCEEHNKKNKIGFCCTYCKEICSTCAGIFNDSHVKYLIKINGNIYLIILILIILINLRIL